MYFLQYPPPSLASSYILELFYLGRLPLRYVNGPPEDTPAPSNSHNLAIDPQTGKGIHEQTAFRVVHQMIFELPP